ncbi:alpha/beta hydrolase [Nocardioides ferulae]|uniref:alpha/beta hydrolase n=1 Tax=Nocardioides ferulae TaxID=2340821 RepID=UPI001F0CD066|nr:alpha/beta hydrolase [Nocardioides ferulae]
MPRSPLTFSTVLLLALATALVAGAPARAADPANPAPGSPAYLARDAQNIIDAYGRIHAPGGQLQNPAYLPALVEQATSRTVRQLLAQVATPNRLSLTAGNIVPGWNVGNPLRAGWSGTRGRAREVSFTNRHGALLRGTVWAPLPRARDPYSGARLRPPYPGVVITTGSVQGSQGMYEWLAQDLAERGYVVLTYDVQGQGTSETLPHETGEAFPFCNPFAEPRDLETTGCPGVPFQQLSNFVVGTEDALDFFVSTPAAPYANPGAAGTPVSTHNPFHRLFDRSPDPRPATPGRTTRIAIVGHSMGAAAVSKVQGTDRRVAAVVALDKLTGPSSEPPLDGAGNRPTVPALAVQAEYGFTVGPWLLSGGSSIVPAASPDGPDPARERATGFDAWQDAGVDAMLVVPRASTHLEFTDIPLVLPASRYGQAITSVYVQRWLDRYLKHRDGAAATARLLGERLRYLEPAGGGRWQPVRLDRDEQLSFYYCSAYAVRDGESALADGDITDAGC